MNIVRLGDLVEITSSKRVMFSDYVDNGIPFYRSKEIIELHNGNAVSTELFISEEHYTKIVSKFGAPIEGDILLTSVGTLGIPYQVIKNDKFYFKDGNLTWFRNFNERANRKFIYYWLTSLVAKQRFEEITIGSTQKALTIVALKSIPLNLPNIEAQERIVTILNALDGKLKNNRQINQTLEAMAQALFKSWFVDFEPVKAKLSALAVGGSADDTNLAAMSAISGKTTEQLLTLKTANPDQYQQLTTTADLFPSEMVDSELGEIPKGWEVGTVGDVASFANGRISVGELNQNNYISTENMLANKEGISSASSLPEIETTPSFQNGQILISNIRPYFKKIWLASFNGGRSGDVLAFNAKNKAQKEFLYNLLYQDSFFDYMMLTSKGAKMPRGDKTAIMNYKIAIPNKNMAEIYSSKVSEFYTQANVLKKQNLVLSKLRDALLPKLLARELLVDGVGDV